MEEVEGLNFAEVIMASMFLACIFALSIILFVFVYQRKLMRQKIDFQDLKLSQERALLFNSLKVQEQERQNLASNLHDELGAQLSIAKMTLSSLEYAETTAEKQSATVKNTLELMNYMADSIRNISYDLLPPSLAQFGLAVAVKEFLNKIPGEKLKVSFNYTEQTKIPDEKQLHLFRIIQESVNNALKHSEATEITILLQCAEPFHLKIQDNGKGFVTELKKANGLGLLTMESRAALIDASLEIKSSSQGTSINVNQIE